MQTMSRNCRNLLVWLPVVLAILFCILPGAASAADQTAAISSQLSSELNRELQLTTPLKTVIALTFLGLIPAFLISMTAFMRIVIVLSMLRHALGLPETPPNSVIISLALFLTLFVMSPTLSTVNQDAFQPYYQNKISLSLALEKGSGPVKSFMIRQTREPDMALMLEISKSPVPEKAEDISLLQLIPAFMLSELKTAFQIGFIIFIPFVLVDLIVSSILMSLGMMMVPPASISLPLKILLFVLIDGWNLVVRALLGTFQ